MGNKSVGHFCVVEFEDGRDDSLFKRQPHRPNPEWSARFEHGFSQLTDWFFNLDDYKKTHGFARTFGYGHVSFTGLLVVGRTAGLDAMKRTRLRWRSDKVLVDSRSILIHTFDDLFDIIKRRYDRIRAAAPLERSAPGPPSAPSAAAVGPEPV